MRWYRSPLPAPRPRERAQRLVHERRRGFARDLARERHARGHRGVGGDAIEGAQLIGAEAQDVVEAGIGGGEGKAEVELGPPAQHARGELVRTRTGLSRPSPLPIGEASGITAAQPASSSRSAITRSSLVYARTLNPSRTSVRAASSRPCTSGSSVSWSPITSSFTNSLNPASRASRA